MQTVRKAEYYYTLLPNRVGEGARVLAGFAAAKIDFHALSGFPSGRRVQLDMVPAKSDAKQFKSAAKKLGLQLVGPKTCFLLQGDDTQGAVAKVLADLAGMDIDVVAMNAAIAGGKRYGMMLWVAPNAVRRAATILRAK